jgi:hypothetical protein
MARPHPPDIIAELEQASAARREKAAEAEAITRINALEARLERYEAALANRPSGDVTWAMLPSFLKEICQEFYAARIRPLEARIVMLEAKAAQLEAESEMRPTTTRSRPGIAWKSARNGKGHDA